MSDAISGEVTGVGGPVTWLASFVASSNSVPAAVCEELSSLGVPMAGDGAGAPGPGIVVFESPSPAVAEAVSERSHGGRVLALAVPGTRAASADPWALLQAGASDVVTWRPEVAPAIAARLKRWEEVDLLVDQVMDEGELLGTSPAWRRALREVVEIARFTTASVLIMGESGTGKEAVAGLIHSLDPRPVRGDLVLVDCTTVVPSLSGSEFFGHERGSFTGAVAPRDGAFARADGGTLFLDEVGELPPSLQAELLRVVQEGMYKRVGSNAWQRTTFRLLCATNRDLGGDMVSGAFRRDFYYRIAATVVRLPPLRERPEDVVPLFAHFLSRFLPDAPVALDPAVSEILRARDYPGNVRDLRQLALRTSARHVGPGPVTPGDLPESEWPNRSSPTDGTEAVNGLEAAVRRTLVGGATLKDVREAATEAAMRVALDDAGGNLHRAAMRLGVTDRALQLRRAGRRRSSAGLGPDGVGQGPPGEA